MASNPLQKYFRQPKVYINLPSKGIYSASGSIEGSTENMPVFAMTGMDEILLKTPDALMTGDATVKILESCCPSIKNGWEVSNLDVDLLLTAIRIATFGNTMTVTHTCPNCESQSDYDIELTKFVEHFERCEYNNYIDLGEIKIRLRPLNYRQVTDFNIKSFALQRQLAQSIENQTDDEQQKVVAELFQQLAIIQNQVFIDGIESVEVPDAVVDRQEFIKEWLTNSEKAVFDAIRDKIEENRQRWKLPMHEVTCPDCGTPDKFEVTLDQTSFFGNA